MSFYFFSLSYSFCVFVLTFPFEKADPGRTSGNVVFAAAQSWVEPLLGSSKKQEKLRSGGRLEQEEEDEAEQEKEV